MDLIFKSAPDTFSDSDTVSCEFLDEKPSDGNIAKTSETYMKSSNVKQIEHNGTEVEGQLGESTTGEGAVGKYFHSRARLNLLTAFQEQGCSLETIDNCFAINNFDVGTVIEYFDNVAKDAQDYVYQECDSLSFNNITEWLKYFKATGRDQQCNYEAAFVLNAIANNELHPKPALMGGIDFVAIYKFLSKSLMGLPQEKLDATSAKFLSDEFQNLIDEANTDAADDDVRNMNLKIEKSLLRTNGEQSYDLDPLNTSTEELKLYYITIKKEENI